MSVAHADAQPQAVESQAVNAALAPLPAQPALAERAPQASLLGSLGDLAPAKPMYVPKQPNDMRRVGLDALEADDAG